MSADYFYKEMKSYMKEYLTFLRKSTSPQVVDRQYDILFFFVDFLYHKQMCTGFEEITAGSMGAKFRAFFINNTGRMLKEAESKDVLKRFFDFIYGKHGIKSDKVMKALGKK